MDDKWLLIRNYDLWANLSDEEYDELNIVHNFIEAHKGDYIYFEAFHHNKLYFVKEGYIRIGYIDDSGREVIREIIQKGELFGQITLEKSSLNGEFAQAYKSEVSLCAFSIEDFQKLLQKKPEAAAKLIAGYFIAEPTLKTLKHGELPREDVIREWLAARAAQS